MDTTLLQFLMWIPFLIFLPIGVWWYFRFPPRQRKNHNAEAAGVIALGFMISLLTWCFWILYHYQDTTTFRITLADKVVWGFIIGVIGSISVLATVFAVSKLKRDQGKKK